MTCYIDKCWECETPDILLELEAQVIDAGYRFMKGMMAEWANGGNT